MSKRSRALPKAQPKDKDHDRHTSDRGLASAPLLKRARHDSPSLRSRSSSPRRRCLPSQETTESTVTLDGTSTPALQVLQPTPPNSTAHDASKGPEQLSVAASDIVPGAMNEGEDFSLSDDGESDADNEAFGLGEGAFYGSNMGEEVTSTPTENNDYDNNPTKQLADSLRLSEQEREILTDLIISNRDHGDDLASILQPMVVAACTDATDRGKEPWSGSINLHQTEDRLYLDDILSLYYRPSMEVCSWYTSTVMKMLLDIGTLHAPANVHVERDIGIFLEDHYARSEDIMATSKLDHDIDHARQGVAPDYGWPLVDLKSYHKRMLMTLNPSMSHWIMAEVSYASNPPRVRIFNSMNANVKKGATYRATKLLPKVLYLASLRPGYPHSPLPTPESIVVSSEVCPRQADHNIDCGPFSIFFAAQRMYGLDVVHLGMAESRSARHHLGQYLRSRCAYALRRYWEDSNCEETLGSFFQGYRSPLAVAPGPTDAPVADVSSMNPKAHPKRPKLDSSPTITQEHIKSIFAMLPSVNINDRPVYENMLSELQQRLSDEQREDTGADKTTEEDEDQIIDTSSALQTATQHSSSTSAVNTPNSNNVAVQPFKERSIWICPYKASGRCNHLKDYFSSLHGVAQHVRFQHAKEELVTSYTVDPMPDGTLKIPCPHGCGEMFVTHQKANHHAKMPECAAPTKKIFICAWNPHNGCTKTTKTARGMANHTRSHNKDPRSPYQCRMEGCGSFRADLYELAMHEERCKGDPSCERETSYRFALTKSASDGAPPSVIIINRSSGEPPKSWKEDADTIKESLPILGRRILAHYAAWSNYPGGSAVLHSCYDAPSRYLPAPAYDDSFLAGSQSHSIKQHRTFKFTQAIVSDIEAANQANIRPTVVSVGADGWFCDHRVITPWLQASTLEFDMIIRLNRLPNGISECFANLHHEVWWIIYDMNHVRKALESGPGHDEKSDQLIATWKTLQDSKDLSFGVNVGRNYVNRSAKFPTVI